MKIFFVRVVGESFVLCRGTEPSCLQKQYSDFLGAQYFLQPQRLSRGTGALSESGYSELLA